MVKVLIDIMDDNSNLIQTKKEYFKNISEAKSYIQSTKKKK